MCADKRRDGSADRGVSPFVAGEVGNGRADHGSGGDTSHESTRRNAIAIEGQLVAHELADGEERAGSGDVPVEVFADACVAEGIRIVRAGMSDGCQSGHAARAGGSGDHCDRRDERFVVFHDHDVEQRLGQVFLLSWGPLCAAMPSARQWRCCQTAAASPSARAAGTAGPSLASLTFGRSETAWLGSRQSDDARSLGARNVASMYPDDPIPALKRQLGAEIARLIADGNAWEIAVAIGTDQPRVSELRRGKLERFSLETLIRYAHRLRRLTVITFEQRRFNVRRSTPPGSGQPYST